MKFDILIAQIEAFHEKTAGLLKLPEELFNDVSEWAIKSYCYYLDEMFDDKWGKAREILKEKIEVSENPRNPWINHVNIIAATCKKLGTGAKPKYHAFDIKTQDIINSYKKDPNFIPPKFYPMEDIPYNKSPKYKEFAIDADFIPEAKEASIIHNQDNWTGLWTGRQEINQDSHLIGHVRIHRNVEYDFKGLLEVPSLETLKKNFEEVKQTVAHELRHFMQDFIKHQQGLKDGGGLPGKKIRDPNYNPSGMPQATDQQRQEHALRDVEFHTRLADEVNYFRQFKTKLPIALQKTFLMAWIAAIESEDLWHAITAYFAQQNKLLDSSTPTGDLMEQCYKRVPSTFFFWLKTNQPEKYRKAVTEFIKAVQ